MILMVVKMRLMQYLWMNSMFLKEYNFPLKFYENTLPISNDTSVSDIPQVLLKCTLGWRSFCFLGHSGITM